MVPVRRAELPGAPDDRQDREAAERIAVEDMARVAVPLRDAVLGTQQAWIANGTLQGSA